VSTLYKQFWFLDEEMERADGRTVNRWLCEQPRVTLDPDFILEVAYDWSSTAEEAKRFLLETLTYAERWLRLHPGETITQEIWCEIMSDGVAGTRRWRVIPGRANTSST